MKLISLFFVVLFTSVSAFANLEIGATAQKSRTWFDPDRETSFHDSENMKVGALLLLPILPGLSFRTGAIHHTRTGEYSLTANVNGKVEDKILEVPLNLQVGLPVTDLYLFGGIVLGMVQDTKCSYSDGTTCTTDKTKNDNSMNVGLGYDLVSFALFRVALEAEYQKGSADLFAGDGTTKQSNFNLGAGFFFGF